MNTRREVLAALGVAAVAGCSTQGSQDTDTETAAGTTFSVSTSTDTATISETPTQTETATATPEPDRDWTWEELYFNWIYGENEQLLQEVEQNMFNFQQIHQAFEQGESRVEKVALAAGKANQQLQGGRPGGLHVPEDGGYEYRHRRITAALHQTLEQSQQYDFNLYSNINIGRAGDNFEYSELMVENTDGEYETIIAQLVDGYTLQEQDGLIHYPGETPNAGEDVISYLRNEEIGSSLPGQDADGIQKMMEEFQERNGETPPEREKEIWGGYMDWFGYSIIGGGHPVESGFDFRPDYKLVPKDQESMNISHEARYGDVDLQVWKDLNEAYLNSDLDTDEEYAVAEWTGDEWNIEAIDNWEMEEGFSQFDS